MDEHKFQLAFSWWMAVLDAVKHIFTNIEVAPRTPSIGSEAILLERRHRLIHCRNSINQLPQICIFGYWPIVDQCVLPNRCRDRAAKLNFPLPDGPMCCAETVDLKEFELQCRWIMRWIEDQSAILPWVMCTRNVLPGSRFHVKMLAGMTRINVFLNNIHTADHTQFHQRRSHEAYSSKVFLCSRAPYMERRSRSCRFQGQTSVLIWSPNHCRLLFTIDIVRRLDFWACEH